MFLLVKAICYNKIAFGNFILCQKLLSVCGIFVKMPTDLERLFSCVNQLMPLELGALHEGLAALGTHVHPGPMRVEVLAHGRVVPEHLVAALQSRHKHNTHTPCIVAIQGWTISRIRQFFFFFFFLLPAQVTKLSITGRDQTGYTVHAGYCMFPQSCDLRTETAGSL
jgi:hypothetical protein